MIDTLTTFQNLLDDAAKWQAANELAITPASFAIETHYDGRMFGVLTGDDKAEKFGTFVINQCVREALWRVLYDVQLYTENFVRYNVSRRTHHQLVEMANFDFNQPYKLDWPGLEAVDVAPVWVNHSLLVDVSPFIAINPTVADLAGNGDMVVTVPQSLLSNPNDVILRRGTDYGVFILRTDDGYPKRSGTDWQIQMANNIVPYNSGDGLVVQSTKYAYVDVTPPMGMTGVLKPVYPGTTEIIPYIKVETVSGNLRYWFYIYNLVDEAFAGDAAVDLIAGEFYKMLPQIEFREYKEAASKAHLTITTKSDCCVGCGDTASEVHRDFQISTRVIDAARGIVAFSVDGQLVTDPDTDITTLDPSSSCNFVNDPCLIYRLGVDYITNPAYLPPRASACVPNLIRAIMHRAAADVPLKDCLCELDYGFIHACQEIYATIATTITGTQIQSNKYGNLHGHKVYEELMNNAYIMKTVRLKGSSHEKPSKKTW